MNTFAVKNGSAIIDKQGVEKILAVAERSINASTDIAEDVSTILALASKESYQAKIEVISKADDMSSKEKLAAINQAEDKYAVDVQNGVTACMSLMWNRFWVVLSCVIGATIIVDSPRGRKFVKKLFT